jgi:hypothetical protein
MRTICAMTL